MRGVWRARERGRRHESSVMVSRSTAGRSPQGFCAGQLEARWPRTLSCVRPATPPRSTDTARTKPGVCAGRGAAVGHKVARAQPFAAPTTTAPRAPDLLSGASVRDLRNRPRVRCATLRAFRPARAPKRGVRRACARPRLGSGGRIAPRSASASQARSEVRGSSARHAAPRQLPTRSTSRCPRVAARPLRPQSASSGAPPSSPRGSRS